MANLHGRTHRRRLSTLISSTIFLLPSLTLSAETVSHSDAFPPRWGQASLLLSDNSLLVYGGKAPGGGGYTYSSSPNTDDLISLSLNSSFSTSSPPWQYLSGSKLSPGTAQAVSYATLGALVEPTATDPGIVLSFGGDVSSSPNLTGTDSSWIITLPPTGSSTASTVPAKVAQQDATWAQQPMRRIRHTLISASGPTSLRLWSLGGQKDDGSETVLDELWQYAAPKSGPLQGIWSRCSAAPSPTFDHASVAMLDSSNQLRIYAMGGIGPNKQALDMSNLYRFTPDLSSDTCVGRWETLPLRGSPAPVSRRGHSIVSLSPTQILLYGGASADGNQVYSDLWLLDLSMMRWSNLNPGNGNSPGARWGHTMVRVGSNVIVAFGFGSLETSQAALSSVGVFDLQQSKWSDSYSPAMATDGRSSAVLQVPNPATHDPNTWQVPGSKDVVKPLPIPSSDGPSGSTPPSTTRILGITFGIFGALILGVGSVVAYRYQKKLKGQRAIAADAYKQKAYGPDFGDGNMGHDDDKVRLVHQEDSLHASHTIPRTRGSMSHRLESTTPGPLKALAGVGVGVLALWPHKRHDKHKERFDILADEESEVWVCTDSGSLVGDEQSVPSHSYKNDKPLKKYDECCTERVRMPPPPPCPMSEVKQNLPSLVTTRGGLRIWDGIDEPAESQCGFGTSTSFLGASLAPWSDDGRGPSSVSEYGQYEYLRGPSPNMSSIGGRGSNSSDAHQSSGESYSRHDPFADPYCGEGSYHTREGTGYSTVDLDDSPLPSNTTCVPSDPFDNEVETLDNWGDSAAGLSNLSLMGTTGNPFLSPKPLERGGTWWGRLRYGVDKQAVADLSPGATHPIRDPTPAPPIPEIHEAEDAHTPRQSPDVEGGHLIDEHGRCRSTTDGSGSNEEVFVNHLTHTSQTSNQTATTATSSMIEAATAHMTVVHRLRSIDSSQMSDSSSLPPHSFQSISVASVSPVDYQMDDSIEEPVSPRPRGPRLNPPMLVSTNHLSMLTMVDSLTPIEQTFPERPPAKRTETAGSVGVRAMVKQFETPTPIIPPGSVDRKQKSHSTHNSDRVKVERSLVRSPLLFVANPDKHIT
ncbi:hypothetical protein MJO28_008142 [Puccinia striiformis f. sp. tritici]|uniref:Uncharacterized protein n=3 Tax=Puccinia striiformis f. sp. tritici TaxID=168172 RepID=A0A0L0VG84_9BASI|nr:hypothetical protein MJO28_008142 [Puccinia striiformis f. sp. tritici]KAI9602494.1 hypothetical protein H4Q26_001783 [Puccinia striiformis f. sp. tritici PST-130]KNE97984.1 hypothetical protein PSTG_08660 [Puccinia striiformis f. sp. tritici PST-78]KAI7952414.1 hypothetical protein MJO29_008045 [Puccinia striiformis f. sp. tritici]KAI9605559.1 hypothetical protein KEM48_002094 [Puccinia striiformis f. sp. tritici PST-130]